jgi:hypothetical protein
MSDALTLLNREDKGDVDPGLQRVFTRKQAVGSPSYFAIFFTFLTFLPLRKSPASRNRQVLSKDKILRAAAFMAIV